MAPSKTDESWSTELFGSKILTKPKTSGVPTSSSLVDKKLVLLYFSASWCPPCKAFSPKLIEFYNFCKNDIDVIFVSSDRDENTFSDYFAKMPWLAMFPAYMSKEHGDRQAKLADMFKIQGIPSVIVLDAKTGNFVTDNARNEVMEASSDASKRKLLQMWLSKEAVPVEQALLSSGGSEGNLLWKVFMFFAKRPTYMFGVLYFGKQLLQYLSDLGKDGNEDHKEL